MLKPNACFWIVSTTLPAAFGRLCVETLVWSMCSILVFCQPPSGGCVLKQLRAARNALFLAQPPSGGCVLKRGIRRQLKIYRLAQPPSGGCVLKHAPAVCMSKSCRQPPSGGCVLKPDILRLSYIQTFPAAFGRLCVETE